MDYQNLSMWIKYVLLECDNLYKVCTIRMWVHGKACAIGMWVHEKYVQLCEYTYKVCTIRMWKCE